MRNGESSTQALGKIAFLCLLFLFGSATLWAQDVPAYQPRGFTAYEQFRGSDSSQGQFLIFDTNVGYDFNQHIGTDIGIPVYLLRPTLPGIPRQWNHSLGDPYWDLRVALPNRYLNYSTAVTLSVPVNETGAYSTGRLGLDWFNHFDVPVGRFTPFVNAGIANGILDTRFLSQPYKLTDSFRTLGFIADTEGGVSFRIVNPLSIGGSYYALLPSGQQKAYAGVQNFFLLPSTTETVYQITHDHGYTGFVRVMPTRNVYLEAAYVHSIEMNFDAATFTVGVDLKSLFSRPHAQQHF
ncbi:MAG TPA: hypothetical protein VJS43_03785 [Candidatus Acidoferrales bacterium]|nr:hypothetical protein [Candidatus Acidoferrales bacterium]